MTIQDFRLKFIPAAAALFGLIVAPTIALAAKGSARITKSGGSICLASDGLPDHGTGRFPNRNNPHAMRAQNIRVCVPANPQKTGHAQTLRGSIGFALNGVMIQPGTADYYDPRSPRKHSRNGNRNWKLDGMGAGRQLGLDTNNAHVDHRGLYHYHGKPTGFLSQASSSLIGFAADGFEIHYVGGAARSGYTLKPGQRDGGPGGRHDGTYVQDWRFTGGPDTLDKCNGGTFGGKFVYFLTDTYPYYPPCLWGKVERGFR
ncbi:YHYH protein [Pseudohoeflea coraliihabitans]|uniref:YHYH protein n=1 Tax=Pseudohoeflea coraliihabitans TaxID=2860393 RepID=A0ABS6WJL6_9HYPH|nr:YHYH protein [Pseudohoeflea sp. DP4N28-3]MBW3096144.1 YHYH protein [Pseudohoeflea sp. DP4N28-3]